MSLPDLIVPIALSAGGASAITFAAWKLFNRYYVLIPPNRALVLYGRRSSGPKGGAIRGAAGVEFRAPRILVGGGAYVPPWRTGSGYLSLEPIDVDVTVRVSSRHDEPALSGWEARVSLQVKIPAESGMLRTAAENLLGKSEEDIRRLVSRTVEGATPPLLVRLPPDDARVDWEQLAAEIQASTARDLVANGLVIRSLSIRDLRRFSFADEVRTGRDVAALPIPELLWTPESPRVRLPALESQLEATGTGRTDTGADSTSSEGESSFTREVPAFLPQDSTDSDLPSRPSGVPFTRATRARNGSRRSSLNVQQ